MEHFGFGQLRITFDIDGDEIHRVDLEDYH
jgi:hypothetical protein